nr:Antibiotic biosynthesis monooxygenase [Mycolicibacterium malmesburyense]
MTDAAATVIIGQRVNAGMDAAFERWQRDLNREASGYAGFLCAEINPPTAVQPEWVVIYRFDSTAHLQAWINSATRQRWLTAGREYFDGPATQQVVGGTAKADDALVTVVVSHRVRADQVDEFLAWQDRLRLAEKDFPGFRGSELFRPVAGVQDEWTAMYRYDTAADLDRWLVSKERRDLLAEGEKFSDFNCVPSTIPSAAGSRSTSTASKPRHRRASRRRSRCGSACTRRSCCSPSHCHPFGCRCG